MGASVLFDAVHNYHMVFSSTVSKEMTCEKIRPVSYCLLEKWLAVKT
jgi:hypothetical protein